MIYLLSYNLNPFHFVNNIHDHIIGIPGVKDWWRYTGVYLIDTDTLNAHQITESIRDAFPGLVHFVVEVDLNQNDGVLPKEAWDWINTKTDNNPQLKSLEALKNAIASNYKNPITNYDPDTINSVLELLKNKK